jgi:uroporphyrin-3 C-methyltransferase
VRDSREQFDELIQAFQTLTDSSSDLVLINDVDHLATIAQQQLQLGGNVANAIISLETAQAQLARANRPSLASLQETINGDLDRLRAATPVDVSFLTGQLEELGNLVSAAPLLVPDDAAPEPVPAPENAAPAAGPQSGGVNADAPWWKQGLQTAQDWSQSAWDSVRQDLGQFITVRRVDDATALLVSPDQATRFRETLRLRVMTAQLALMMRQPKVWQAETEKLVQAVQSRYDSRSPQSRQALKIARQLADTSIDVKLPSVANTLRALESLREAGADDAGRSPGEQAPPDAQPDPSGDDGPADGTAPAGTEAAVPASGPATDPALGQPDSARDQEVPSVNQSQV